MADPTYTDPTTAPPAPPTLPPIQVPSQLAPPVDNSLTGSNWARNLMVLGGQMSAANNARFGKGFLANPGTSGINVGLGNAVGQIGNLDQQAATTQQTLAEAEATRMTNAYRAYGLQHPEMYGGSIYTPEGSLSLTGNKGGGGGTASAAPRNNAPSLGMGVYDDVATGPDVVPEALRADMVTKAVESQHLPKYLIPLAMGLFNHESRFDAARDNKDTGAIGIGQVLPSTAKSPGFDMEGVDPASLRDPQTNMNFSLKYLYQRGRAMGMTNEEDYADPGKVSALLLRYGGQVDGNGAVKDQDTADRYVQGVIGHGLAATGHQSYDPRAPISDLMAQLLHTKVGARPTAAPSSPVATGAAAPIATAAPATPEAASQAAMGNHAALQQAMASGQPSIAGGAGLPAPTTTQPQQQASNAPAPGYASNGEPLAAGSWDASPVTTKPAQFAGPGAPTDAAATPPPGPVPHPDSLMAQRQQATQGAAPAPTPQPLPITPTPRPAAPPTAANPAWVREDGSPVPTGGPQITNPIQSAQAKTGAPQQNQADVDQLVNTLTNQAERLTATAQRLRGQAQFAANAGNPQVATQLDQKAAAFQAQAQVAFEKAATLKTDYVKQRATIGTNVDEVVNGIPGQRNSVTNEWKPNITGSSRLTLDSAGNMWAAPPDGKAPYMVAPADSNDIRNKAAAAAQGTALGTKAGDIPNKLLTLLQESDTNIGNLDYGMNRLNEAAKAGVPTGYFSPWLLHGIAAAKSLGINVKAVGIDPDAVGYAQSAQKTLAIMGGALIQQAIGKDSAITDAKIEHFIHASPGIETDPQALERVMAWARSQYLYSHDLALDGLKKVDAKSGYIDPGWQADYVARKGAGAPIFNPLTGSMDQPKDGTNIARELPSKDTAGNANKPPPPKSYDAAVLKLRANPSSAAAFDKRYGNGAARSILEAEDQ